MPDINQSNDNNSGRLFTFSYTPDGVYITVTPSSKIDKSLLVAKVFERVLKKKIRNLDKNALQAAIMSATGQPAKFAEPQEEVRTDATVSVGVSSDKMSAWFVLIPPDGGNDITLNELIKQIQSKGIVFGADSSIMQEAIRNPQYNQNIFFAKGEEPVKGEDGKVELLVNVNVQKKPTILEDGSVDFHELHYVETARKGQVLANIILPSPGMPGKNVLGQIVPPISGKPALIPRGRNVEFADNGTKLVAAVEGQVNYYDNKISILNVLEIHGDVDVSVGNIHFNGNIVVWGNVLTDFMIEATGNIEVHGVVEGAIIRAGEDIILNRGIQGLNKGVLESGNDIVARYMEHCKVTAKNDIKAEAIMHCTVDCGHSIELGGKKGLIVGGSVKVGKEINAKYIGSSMSTVTEIEIGVDPTIRDRYKKAKEKSAEYEKELKQAEQSIEILNKMKKAGTLNIVKLNNLNSLLKTKNEIDVELPKLVWEINEIEEKLADVSEARLKVQDTIYPGVKITIGNVMKFIRENTRNVIFYSDGADIKAMPLK